MIRSRRHRFRRVKPGGYFRWILGRPLQISDLPVALGLDFLSPRPRVTLGEGLVLLAGFVLGSPGTAWQAIQEYRAWQRESSRADRQRKYGHHAPSSEE